MRHSRTYIIILTCCLWPVINGHCSLPVKKIQVERLPNLHVPRSGHHLFVVNGEPTVVGGHTSGFVPTPTAEYFSEGEWHKVDMVYTHGFGLCQPLADGKVLVAGGNEKPLGIGQTFTIELYDPLNHVFEGYGCMEQKRFFPSSALLADSTVVISGNSYHDDCTERFDGSRQNKFVGPVSQQRSNPFIFPIANNDALIFGANDVYQHFRNDTIIIDRLKGQPFKAPLFDEWSPLRELFPIAPSASFIGDASTGLYAYLLPVFSKQDGQMAIARIDSTSIQLLPTTGQPPITSLKGDTIDWFSSVIVDRDLQRGYVVGRDITSRYYVLRVDYAHRPAPLSVGCTEPLTDIGYYPPVLTDDGNLLMVGGIIDNNYTPYSSVVKLLVRPEVASASRSSWLHWLLAVAGVAVVCALSWWRRGRKRISIAPEPEPSSEVSPIDDNPVGPSLMDRIVEVMEEQKLYLNSELKVVDVATKLNTNSRYVSDCIKASRGISFSQFVNAYRIDYAKQLLSRQPDAKLTAIALDSGFTNQTSFFRTFKAITGTTPREWILTEID